MAQYTNAQIAAAVLNKWAQPIISDVTTMIAANKIQNIPFLSNIENMAKHWGLVTPNYSIVNEIPNVIQPLSSTVLLPAIHKQLEQIDDAFIPQMMHETVDNYINQGGLIILEKVNIEVSDFEKLKNLLNFNMPITAETSSYVVLTEAAQ